jgi:hypothetical protein
MSGTTSRRFPADLAGIRCRRHLCRSYMRAPEVASISYAPKRIFVFNGSREPVGSAKMACYLTSDDKYRGTSCEGTESSLGGHEFARGRVTGSHGRSVLSRLTGYLSRLVEAVADAKMRHMRRELELNGVRLDQSDEVWIASSLREPRA